MDFYGLLGVFAAFEFQDAEAHRGMFGPGRDREDPGSLRAPRIQWLGRRYSQVRPALMMMPATISSIRQ